MRPGMKVLLLPGDQVSAPVYCGGKQAAFNPFSCPLHLPLRICCFALSAPLHQNLLQCIAFALYAIFSLCTRTLTMTLNDTCTAGSPRGTLSRF